jgi:hypothetical protein
MKSGDVQGCDAYLTGKGFTYIVFASFDKQNAGAYS